MFEISEADQDKHQIKQELNRSLKSRKRRAFLLVLPVLLFLMVSFVFPIMDMLFRSVQNSEIPAYLPRTTLSIKNWDETGLPSQKIYDDLLQDLTLASKNKTIGKLATRLNYEKSGMRSLLTRTGRKLKKHDLSQSVNSQDFLTQIHKKWSQPDVFKVIKRESSPYTKSYYVAAFDLKYNDKNEIVDKSDDFKIYMDLFYRTLWMSLIITFLTFILGFPIAYLLASLPLKYSNLLMILILLPFWTSLLVRTSTWIAILQTHGVLNDVFIWIGIIPEGSRIQMIHNSTGTFIAMTHILLPFMILPLYSVMKTINPSYVRAARSMGAHAFHAFRRVYFPMTLPGLGAGGVLVFILSVGYYITPALVGGQSGRFITNMIAHHMNSSLNWGLAAALATILLIIIIALYFLYSRFTDVRNIKFG